MMQRHIRPTRPLSSLARWASCAALPISTSLVACSSDTVTMGENGVDPAPLSSSSRCYENPDLEGDVVVRNQEELDALEGCETIDGDLDVRAFLGADLRSLHALSTVSGMIDLGDTYNSQYELEINRPQYWLDSLVGLESLESVGDLSVSGLLANNVEPLHNLRVLTGGELALTSAPNLEDLGGLRNLRGIRTLNLTCYVLESLDPLVLPEHMERIDISETPLTQLSPLGVRSAALSLSETQLENLDSFSSLSSTQGISIVRNSALENMDGLDGLLNASGIQVEGNAKLTHLPEFPELMRLDWLTITNNHRLAQLSSFPKLWYDYLVGDTYLDETPELLVAWRPEWIEISGNVALTALALPAGWLSGSTVKIENNAALARLELTKQRSVDYLTIKNNPALQSVNLGALATVNTLELVDNPMLDTSAFDAVQTFERIMTGNAGATP